MLSIFPELFTFSFFVIGLFRIAIGVFHTLQGVTIWRESRHISGLLQAIGGGFLTIGLFTQPAALILAGLVIFSMRAQEDPQERVQPLNFSFLLLCATLLLLFIGPGALALDLPF